MPTVWASVPMHAPDDDELAAQPLLDLRVDLLRGQQGELPLDDDDVADVDEVGDRAVDDEEREVGAHRLGVHEQRGLQPHLRGQLQGRPLGALVVRERKREGDLDHAVAGGVAVRPHERTAGAQAQLVGVGVLHAALRVVGVASSRHRVAPSSSSVVAGLSYPGALRTTPSSPLPLLAGRFIEPKVPSAIAASSGGSPAVSESETIASRRSTASPRTCRARVWISPSAGGGSPR